MKRLLIAVALLTSLFTAGVQAQTTTTYYGVIRDLANNPVTSGKVTLTLRPSTDVTESGLARFTTQTITCPIASTGNVVGLANSNVTATTGTTAPGTSVTVASATGFANGQPIVIAGAGAAGAIYVGSITSVVSNTFTVSPATSTSVSAGAAVYTGCQVAMNTALQPPNSGYLLKFWPGNVNTATIFTYALNSATDITTVVSTQAQLPSVGGFLDSFSNQTIGGNKTFTGTTLFSGSGIFTNSQMNLATQSLLNGVSPSTEFVASHPTLGFTTEAFTAGAIIPSSATVLEVNANGGYVQSPCNSASDTKCVGIAGYFQGRATGNGASVQGVNSLVQDQVGVSGAYLKNEFDLNPNGSPFYATYLQLNGIGTGTMPAAVAIGAPCTNVGAAVIDIFSGFCNSGNSVNPAWPLGFAFRRGSLVKDASGIQLDGCLGALNIPCGSYKISLTGYDSGNAAHTGFVAANSVGDVVVTPASGSALRAPIESPGSLGPTPNNAKYVDGQTFTTTGAVADNCENYPTNNGLRTCVINSPPELITANPFPPNFSVEWRIMPGSVNSTVSNSTNINSIVTAVPLILGSNASIYGTAGPVGSGGNFSGGSAIIASDTYPPILGVPTGGAAVTCNGSGSVTAPFIAVRMVNNLQTHPGSNPASGFGAYVKRTGCTGVASIDVTAPTGFNAGALTPVDFEVGVSATVNGVYYLQVPGSGLTCGVAGTVNSNEACKLTGGAHITAVQSQNCSSSCTQPFEMDEANGTPFDSSNCMIVFGVARAGGGWSTQTFNTQVRDITIAAQPTGHGVSQPNGLICNFSAEENSGTPVSQMQFYGDAGGYTGVTGAFIYNGPWAPNSNWSHIQASGGPTATANPFWAVIVDGHPTSPPVGGASGGTRQMTDNTLNLRGGATANGAILIQGNRANVGVSDSHAEILNANDAYFVTSGARAQFSHVEGFTGGIALHISSTAGMVEVTTFCNQGTNSSNQDRCTPGATSIQDDTTGGVTLKGPINHYSSGMSIAKVVQFNPMTFANLTSIFACAAGTEGTVAAITDDNTAVAFNATITGGGTHHVHGYCDGTNWVMQ